MLLAIDVGNTCISMGIFNRDKLIKRTSIPTNGYSRGILKAKIRGISLKGAIVSSVVPAVTFKIVKDLRSLPVHPALMVVGKDLSVPIKNLYRFPKQVGADRLVNAYAGIRLYGAPLIIVDFGTAVTFDVISKKGAYLGGMILPGLRISLESLYRRTALLPNVKLVLPITSRKTASKVSYPGGIIGKDTKSSMLSGIFYGFAALTDGVIDKINKETGIPAKVIGTGGDIRLIAPYCRKITKIAPDLTLTGLNRLFTDHFHPRHGIHPRYRRSIENL